MNANAFNFLSTGALVGLIVASLLLSLLSSLLTNVHMVPEVAGIVTTVLAAATGVLTTWVDKGGDFTWHEALAAFAVSLLLAFLGRQTMWKGSESERKALNAGSKDKLATRQPPVTPPLA